MYEIYHSVAHMYFSTANPSDLSVSTLFQDDISMVFKMADKDNSGTLTLKEINDVLKDICIRYPQVELYMKSMHMLDIADLIKGAIGDSHKESMVVDTEEFKKALSHVDSQVKNAPATAQVCSMAICKLSVNGIYSSIAQTML